MSEANKGVPAAGDFLKPDELKRKVKIVPQQPTTLKILDRSLQPEELATVCKMYPDQTHAVYSDYVLNIMMCRAALDDFEHWNAIAQASTGDEDQLSLALRMMGQAIGLWHQGLNGFRVPFQRVLIVPKAFTRGECEVPVYQQIFVGIHNQIWSHMQPNVNNPYNPVLQKIYGYVFVEFERTIGPLPQPPDVQTLLMPPTESPQTPHGAQTATQTSSAAAAPTEQKTNASAPPPSSPAPSPRWQWLQWPWIGGIVKGVMRLIRWFRGGSKLKP